MCCLPVQGSYSVSCCHKEPNPLRSQFMSEASECQLCGNEGKVRFKREKSLWHSFWCYLRSLHWGFSTNAKPANNETAQREQNLSEMLFKGKEFGEAHGLYLCLQTSFAISAFISDYLSVTTIK